MVRVVSKPLGLTVAMLHFPWRDPMPGDAPRFVLVDFANRHFAAPRAQSPLASVKRSCVARVRPSCARFSHQFVDKPRPWRERKRRVAASSKDRRHVMLDEEAIGAAALHDIPPCVRLQSSRFDVTMASPIDQPPPRRWTIFYPILAASRFRSSEYFAPQRLRLRRWPDQEGTSPTP